MLDSIKHKIKRYSIGKEFITTGEITIVEYGSVTEIFYKDEYIEETESDSGHPMVALIALRQKLESKHKSILALNGSRVDTTLRPTGNDIAYVIRENIIDENDWLCIFESTNEVDKLCTVEEHEKAYDKWCEIVLPKEKLG